MKTYYDSRILMSVKLTCALNYDIIDIMQMHTTKNTPMDQDFHYICLNKYIPYIPNIPDIVHASQTEYTVWLL